MGSGYSFQRLASVARKEFYHIFRDTGALFFTLFIPILELFMLGYAIDTNVRNIPTVVLDQARTQESRELVRQFANTEDFRILREVFREDDLTRAIVAGEARVGIKVPEDYSRRLEAGDTAQVLILVDGSLSTVAGEAVNVGNAVALRASLSRLLGSTSKSLPIESRPRVLFNPDTRSPNFFIPGLMVVMCQMMAVMLSATAIVREKEQGTMEQLFMTPVRSLELVLGKLVPYFFLTYLEFCTIAFLMRTIFQVPIHGSFLTLLALALPFVLSCLGFGLVISTRAATREAAGQMAMGTMLPAIFLSGYVFPLESLPPVFLYVAKVIPTTWLIDASRGVILRGAGWAELWPHAVVLWLMSLVVIGLAMLKFRKQLA
jgi:ABC-2 type transport system permease protein